MNDFIQRVPDISSIIPDPCWILEGNNGKDIVGDCCISVLIFNSKKLAFMRKKEILIWNVRPKKYSRDDLVIKFVFSEIIKGIIINKPGNGPFQEVFLRKIIAI